MSYKHLTNPIQYSSIQSIMNFQFFVSLPKNLNKKSLRLNKLKIQSLIFKFKSVSDIFNYSRYISMCDNDKLYFRIETPAILPKFFYYHLINDFKLGKIRSIGLEKQFLNLRNLYNHTIYGMKLSEIGSFVKKEEQANISIIRSGSNLGTVTLLKEDYFQPEWNYEMYNYTSLYQSRKGENEQ